MPGKNVRIARCGGSLAADGGPRGDRFLLVNQNLLHLVFKLLLNTKNSSQRPEWQGLFGAQRGGPKTTVKTDFCVAARWLCTYFPPEIHRFFNNRPADERSPAGRRSGAPRPCPRGSGLSVPPVAAGAASPRRPRPPSRRRAGGTRASPVSRPNAGTRPFAAWMKSPSTTSRRLPVRSTSASRRSRSVAVAPRGTVMPVGAWSRPERPSVNAAQAASWKSNGTWPWLANRARAPAKRTSGRSRGALAVAQRAAATPGVAVTAELRRPPDQSAATIGMRTLAVGACGRAARNRARSSASFALAVSMWRALTWP